MCIGRDLCSRWVFGLVLGGNPPGLCLIRWNGWYRSITQLNNTFDNTPPLALKGSRSPPLLNHDFDISSEIFRLHPVRLVEIATMRPTLDITANQLKTLILNNTLVTFGPGADVLSMLHPSDYSAIRFAFPIAGLTASEMATYLHSFFDEAVGVPRVHMITTDADERCRTVAHVQVQDPTFAARVQGQFNRYLSWRPYTKMSVAPVPVEMRYESGRPSSIPAGLELQLLQDRHAMLRLRDRPAAPECAVCMTEAEDAIQPLAAINTAGPASSPNVPPSPTKTVRSPSAVSATRAPAHGSSSSPNSNAS